MEQIYLHKQDAQREQYELMADAAMRDGTKIPPVRAIFPNCTVQDAYEIQFANQKRRLADGWKTAGYKVGVIAPAAQESMKIAQPVLGLLYQNMICPSGGTIAWDGLNKPVLEVEIALTASRDITVPLYTLADAAACVDSACIAIEIASGRLMTPAADAAELIADGTAARNIILGAPASVPALDLRSETATLYKNGESIQIAGTASVFGDPLKSLIWLADMLLAQGRHIQRGDIIMTGSLTAGEPISKGDLFLAHGTLLGDVAIQFA